MYEVQDRLDMKSKTDYVRNPKQTRHEVQNRLYEIRNRLGMKFRTDDVLI